MADESRQINSGFVPIIPSQLDLHPVITLNGDPHMNPIFAEQNYYSTFYRGGPNHLSTARPFTSRNAAKATASRYAPSSTKSPFDQSILGSGDFTVIRGGTFYPDIDDAPSNDYYGSGTTTYYDSNTGRPFALPLERPQQPHYSDDPFANFKDFADINAGVDTDFSHFVVVYANRNETNVHHEPKNILELLEQQEKDDDDVGNSKQVMNDVISIKTPDGLKLSKFKTKLFSTKKLSKEQKKKKQQHPKAINPSSTTPSTDYIDPLVAES